jgi:CubicO group peptidase (beta-lactamase class C family)
VSDPVADGVRRLAGRLIEAHATPGTIVAWTDRDGLLGVVAAGHADPAARVPVTPSTLFQIGSISKSFTAVSLLRLAEQDRLAIDDEVTRHLPWFPLAGVSIRQLLTHTAGIVQGIDALPASPHTVLALAGAPRVRPGRFWYSNVGYQTLGYLLEAVTGRPFGDVYREVIFGPLGMGDASPVIETAIRNRLAVGHLPLHDDRSWAAGAPLAPAPWLPYGAGDGSVCSTAADLAAYARMLLRRGEPVLSETSYEELVGPAVDDGEGDRYGLGLSVIEQAGRTLVGHTGATVGYRAMMLTDPEAGLGAVAMINGHRGAAHLAEHALALLRDGDAADPALDDLGDPAAALPLDPAPPDAWSGRVGLYRSHNPWEPVLRVVLSGGAPHLIVGTAAEPLVELDDGTYRIGAAERIPERLAFDAPVAGRVHRLWYSTSPYVRTFDG